MKKNSISLRDKEIYMPKMGAISLLMIASLTIMVGTVVAPGLMNISSNLGVSDYAAWLITVPSLGVVIFSFFFEKVVEKLGYYNALKIGLLLYGLLGAGGVFLHGFVAIFADRFLLGGATGIVLVSVNGLITYFYQDKQRLKMIALQAVSIELGGVIILGVSGVLAVLGWQYPFALYLFAWVFLIMLMLFIPDPKNHLKVQLDEDLDIEDSLKKVFLTVTLSMFLFFIAVIVLPIFLPKFGFSEDKIGYLLSFVSFVAIIAAGFTPKLSTFLSTKFIIILAFVCYMSAYLILSSSTEIIYFVIAAFLLGFGFGLSIPTLNHITIERSNAKSLSKNLSLYTRMIFLGQFLASFSVFLPGELSNIFFIASFISLFVMVAFGVTNI